MNRIIELHTTASNLILIAQAELRTIAQISQSEQDSYEKMIHIKEHQRTLQKYMRSYLRTIREIERIIQGEVI
jgi:hypothetical protein